MPKQVSEKIKGITLQGALNDLSQRAVCNSVGQSNDRELLNIGGNYIHVVDDFRRQLGSIPICIQESQVSSLQEDIARIAGNNDYKKALDLIVQKWILLARQECKDCLTKNCAYRDPDFELEEEKKPKLVMAK